jgi:hypothetical protein
MIWADRFGIGMFAFGMLIWVFRGGLRDSSLQWWTLPIVAGFIGVPFWAIFRTLDFMAGGPRRRRMARDLRGREQFVIDGTARSGWSEEIVPSIDDR